MSKPPLCQKTLTNMREPGRSQPRPPGASIGILGSGQLGRMLALAAARLGLKCHIYADAPGSAMDVAAAHTIAPYDDLSALTAFAQTVSAVTYEFENVPVATVEHLDALVPVRPGSRALAVSQDRLTEKTFMTGLGLPVARFAAIDRATDLSAALAAWQTRAILKSRRLGYDGKGQLGVAPGDDIAVAFAALGGQPAILEQRLSFVAEYSVLLVRGLDGATAAYDIPANTHKNGILDRSVVPAGLDAAATMRALSIARTIAEALDYVGLLAVELFDLGPALPLSQRLVVNEIAPRVHNSGHWTIEACAISQFENHIRAVAGWPLGSCWRHGDAEVHNLIGAQADDWHRLAGEPGAAVHLYGKGEARPGRKMGHVTRLSPRTAG